jgi:hypothetical protein
LAVTIRSKKQAFIPERKFSDTKHRPSINYKIHKIIKTTSKLVALAVTLFLMAFKFVEDIKSNTD